MAVTATLLTSGGSSPGSSYNTASISPSSNKLVLVSVANYHSGGAAAVSSITGCGMTWESVVSATAQGGSWRMSIWRSMSASPSSGALTINFGSNQDVGAHWSVIEFGNVNTSGSNGSGAIVQSAASAGGGSGTSATATLGAFGSTDNATFGAGNSQGTISLGGGFTGLHQNVGGDGAGAVLTTEWRTDNDTSVDLSWVSASYGNVLGLEIKFQAPPALGDASYVFFM